MKTIKEEITVEIYVCEFCGNKSQDKSIITACEEEHRVKNNCKHKSGFEYEAEITDEHHYDDYYEYLQINRKCKKCHEVTSTKFFVSAIPEKIMVKLFKGVKNEKSNTATI